MTVAGEGSGREPAEARVGRGPEEEEEEAEELGDPEGAEAADAVGGACCAAKFCHRASHGPGSAEEPVAAASDAACAVPALAVDAEEAVIALADAVVASRVDSSAASADAEAWVTSAD